MTPLLCRPRFRLCGMPEVTAHLPHDPYATAILSPCPLLRPSSVTHSMTHGSHLLSSIVHPLRHPPPSRGTSRGSTPHLPRPRPKSSLSITSATPGQSSTSHRSVPCAHLNSARAAHTEQHTERSTHRAAHTESSTHREQHTESTHIAGLTTRRAAHAAPPTEPLAQPRAQPLAAPLAERRC